MPSARRNAPLLRLAGVALAGGLAIGWGRPLWQRLAHLEQEASTAQQRVAQLQALMQRRAIIEQQAQTYAKFSTAEPEEVLQRQLLDELERWAEDTGVQLNLQPRPVQREDVVSRLKVEVELEGPQAALLAFLDRMLSTPSLLQLDRVHITAASSKDSRLRANLVVTRLLLHP